MDWSKVTQENVGQIDFNKVSNNGYGAIHYLASQNKDFKVIETAIRNGADINLADKQGHTPLDHAIIAQNKVISKGLQGIGINAKSLILNNSYVIKDFGNESVCNSILDLKEKLANKYDNKAVSIIHTTASGMKKVEFVSVKNKQVYSSYDSKNSLFDFDKLSKIPAKQLTKHTKGALSQTLAKRRAKTQTQGLER